MAAFPEFSTDSLHTAPNPESQAAPHTSSAPTNLRDAHFPTEFIIPKFSPLLDTTLQGHDMKCRQTGQKFEPTKKLLTEILNALSSEIFKYTYYPTDENIKVRDLILF